MLASICVFFVGHGTPGEGRCSGWWWWWGALRAVLFPVSPFPSQQHCSPLSVRDSAFLSARVLHNSGLCPADGSIMKSLALPSPRPAQWERVVGKKKKHQINTFTVRHCHHGRAKMGGSGGALWFFLLSFCGLCENMSPSTLPGGFIGAWQLVNLVPPLILT